MKNQESNGQVTFNNKIKIDFMVKKSSFTARK
ncbi:hypothetical protein LVISKB_P1-0035 (plasmid) [Levilactobacillus brevis KB290]|uniref:Uncharacterized protein n=1 Tax=Levilactobacillus brevis KB290 TaxID=1001583 RepID=M5B1M2_LEVBR|nr:hypothetical protein LVISKB_P1-0035 [Levilactobacillus brevis KB290]